MSAPIKFSKDSFIKRHRITVAAGVEHPVNIYGKVFACTDATGPFEMSFNSGEWFPCRKGIEWSLVGEDRYNKLSFRAVVATTVEFYGGNFFWHENVVVPVIQHARTRAWPWSATSIGPGADIFFNSTPAGMSYRRGIIITNNDTSVDLEVHAQDGTGAYFTCAIVFAKQAWYLETSDNLCLHNPSAGAVNFRALQTFYLA
jgi:hypothetical protein